MAFPTGRKNTFVCFHCRVSAKRACFNTAPLCQCCAAPMIQLRGTKIPRQKDVKGWEQLWQKIVRRRRIERERRYYSMDFFKRIEVEKLRGKPI